jgi:polyisoprenyl-phosphate glycosyltransferase
VAGPVKISVVSPVYGCRACLEALCERVAATLAPITDDFEIILVNDACPQGSWESIQALARQEPRIKGINLSRNFGQHYAITAGLDHAQGDWVVVMDCDLQDKPEEIAKLYAKAMEGYEIVFGQRVERQDSFFKKFASRLFYWVLEYFTDTEHDKTIANFGIFSRKVIDTVNLYREQNRSFPLFVKIAGFSRTQIPVEHDDRLYGRSSYNFTKMVNLAIDSIVAHSNKPLRLFIQFGFFIALGSMLYAGWLVLSYFLYGDIAEGWTSLMVSMFFMFGLLFGILGILGLYIGKIFDEVKGRPLYIIQESVNFDPAPQAPQS